MSILACVMVVVYKYLNEINKVKNLAKNIMEIRKVKSISLIGKIKSIRNGLCDLL